MTTISIIINVKKYVVSLLVLAVILSLCACSGKKESTPTATPDPLTSILSSEPTAAETVGILGKEYDDYDEGKNYLTIIYNSFPFYGLSGKLILYFERQSEGDRVGDYLLDAFEWIYSGNSEEIISTAERITTDFNQSFGKPKEIRDSGHLYSEWKNDRLLDVVLEYLVKNEDNEWLFSEFQDSSCLFRIGYGNV